LPSHRKPARTRYVVTAAVALGVAGAAAAGVASAQTVDHRGAPVVRPVGASLGAVTLASVRPKPTRHHPRPTASATATPTATPTTATPTTAAPTSAPTTQPTTAPPSTATPTSAAPTTSAPAGDAVITAALDHINAARVAGGLTPYTLNVKLSQASQAHNALMAGGCGLSHQCPGEAGLGDRFTAAGVSWSSAGENIGQGNAADDQAQIIAAANGLTDLMLAEQAPNDGHRKNLLNAGFKQIGLAVTRDSTGKVWFTQDFVN
jgi:uncharacterized protein YkwD